MNVTHEATPNWRGSCAACGQGFERYVRKSKAEPQFCSKDCYHSTLPGRSLTADHRAKIGMSRSREKHPLWKGDDAKPKTGRCRARNWFEAKPCATCGAARSERHHVDGNTLNNAPSNIQHLCRRCHMTVDGRIENVAGRRKNHASS